LRDEKILFLHKFLEKNYSKNAKRLLKKLFHHEMNFFAPVFRKFCTKKVCFLNEKISPQNSLVLLIKK